MELVYELVWIVLMNMLELSAIVLVLRKLNKQILTKHSHMAMLVLVLSTMVCCMVYFNVPLIEIIVPLILILILKWISEVSMKKLIVLYVIDMTYIMIYQIIITSTLKLMGVTGNNFYIAIASNIILFVIAAFTYQYIPIDKVVPLIDRFETIIFWLVSLIGIPLTVYLIAWKVDYNSINYISLIVIGIILWTGIVALVFKELFQIKQREKANEIYMEYNPMLESLINDVKAKQHDIKNQLHAIYGIAERNGDDELTKYLQSIISGYQFHHDDALLNTGSNIVSSILYSKKNKSDE